MNLAEPVVPGPCGAEGAPAPTEIACVEVRRVYDFCFQTDTRENVRTRVPGHCRHLVPGSTISGQVASVDCEVRAITPIAGSGGFANVTLLITVRFHLQLVDPDGHIRCTFPGHLSFLKTVTLCAPTGVTVTCSAPASAVGLSVAHDCEVVSQISVCLLIEASASVKLLVPSYGFCLPAPCVVLPSPPLSCPPSPLFPPQCPGTLPTVTPTVQPTCPPCGR